MKKISARLLSFILVLSMIVSVFSIVPFSAMAQETEIDYTQYVDPFVGTDVDYGQLFPGSVVPYGLVKLSPDTYPHNTLDHAGYDYTKTQIEGFSHTRVEGVGGQGAGGDILITPTYVTYYGRPSAASRAQNYNKDTETAAPGYYSVELTPKTGTDNDVTSDSSKGSILAEMTTDTRTGYHRYTLPEDGNFSLVVDLNYTYHGTDIRNAILNVVDYDEESGKTTLEGRFSGRNVSGHGKYTLYFYMETSQPVLDFSTWNGSNTYSANEQAGNDIGAVLVFDGKKDTPVEVKVSVSPISSEQAKIDMYNEIPDWDFDAVRESAKSKWNDVLSKIKVNSSEISDPDGRLTKLFYTHLYHMFTTPVNATSTTGIFRATDGNIYEADGWTYYDSWTLWDDFRKYPMIGLVLPDVYKDIIRSLAATMEYGIGTWGIDTQTVPTVRTEHAVALLADGIAKGFTDIPNLEAAYKKAKSIADSTVNANAQRLGYIDGRVDRTVEFSYDDWCISLLAEHLGYDVDQQNYLARSFYYKNLYKADAVTTSEGDTIGLLWPKDSSGNWKSANPERYGDNGLYQGTLWQYTWWDTNDVLGLMNLMGGKQNMYKALSRLYGEQDPDNGKAMLHTNTNEIDLQTPYLFNFVGRADRTQYWVRQIYTEKTWNRYSGTGEFNPPIYDYVYKLAPNGFLETMDDDAGTMAAMYVAAALGIFPMTPGDTTFQIGSPFFESVELDVGSGKTFTIKANNVSADNFYIQSAKLNGESFDRTWVDYSEIIRGGVLEFNMGTEPSDWASDGVTAFSSSEYTPTDIYSNDPVSFSKLSINESDKNDGSFDEVIEIGVSSTQFVGDAGEDLIASGKISVSNVPAGLAAKAILKDSSTVDFTFEGKAAKHSLNDCVSNVGVKLNDSLFAQAVTSAFTNVNNFKVMFRDNYLSFSKDIITETYNGSNAFDDSIEVTLTGTELFTGENGEDYVASGKLSIANLPANLTATATKTADNIVTVSFKGTNVSNGTDDMIISFVNSAFSGGNAAKIENSNYGGMRFIKISVYGQYREKLEALVAQAKEIKADGYAAASYEALQAAIASAQALLEKEGIDESLFKDECDALNDAINGLKILKDGYNILEAESYDVWSGGELKTESSTDSTGASLTNIGATYDGAWIGYEALDFGETAPENFIIRYVNNSGRCAADAKLEIRLGSPDGQLIQTVPLEATGNGWAYYEKKSFALENAELLTGVQDVYFVMRGTTTAGNPYIMNLDYLQFAGQEIEYKTYGKYEAEHYDVWSQGSLKTENSSDSTGASLSNVGGTYDGAWLGYKNFNFDGEGLYSFTVRYVNNAGRCGDNAYLELRSDDPLTGEILGKLDIPAVDSTWNSYTTATLTFDPVVTGKHDVYIIMHADTSNKPYVANIDWFEFKQFVPSNTYGRYEAEGYDAWSGGQLKTENSTDSTGASLSNLANTHNGAWVSYKDVNFDGEGLGSFSIRYSKRGDRGGSNAYAELLLDDPSTGKVVGRIDLPATATNSWAIYNIVSADVTENVTGVHDLYVVLHADSDGSGYVGNIDWFEFTQAKAIDYNTYGKYEAESYEEWSQGGLKTENSTDSTGATLTNIGGTYDGAWVGYKNFNFDGEGLGRFKIRYVNNSGRCGANAYVEIRLDNPETGELVQKIDIPHTGSNWNAYDIVTAKIDTAVTGVHDVYIIMHAETDASHPYIANIDWFQFIENGDESELDYSALLKLYEESLPILNNASAYDGDTFTSFKSAMTKADRILNMQTVTQAEIDEAANRLEKAISELAEYVSVYGAQTDAKEYVLGTPTTFTVVTSKDVEKVVLYNENGRIISASTVNKTESGKTNVWTITSVIGTKGSRTVHIYTARKGEEVADSGVSVDFTVDIAISEGGDKAEVLSYRAPEAVKVDEAFTITVKTSTSVTKVGIFDANTGKALGKISQSYTDKNGVRVWTIALKVGTKGNRSFDIKATDATGVWSEGKQFNIGVYKVD